jgi:Spy/CpxP family protein refolding chaperone
MIAGPTNPDSRLRSLVFTWLQANLEVPGTGTLLEVMKMSKSCINRWIALAAILVVATGAAFAQAGAGIHMRRLGLNLGMMSDYLDLTAAQQAQVKQVIASEKPALIPLIQQLVQSKSQILQEVSSGTFDQAKIAALATQQSQIQAQLSVEKAKTLSQIFEILTPDQKAKAVTLLQKRAARVEQRLQNAQQDTTSQP